MSDHFNATEYLVDRHVEHGRGQRLALTGPQGDVTYAELQDRVSRTANGLRAAGLRPEQRLVMFMADGPEFVVVFLAALRMGAIPVPISTMLRADGLAELLRDARAIFLAVTPAYADTAAKAAVQAPEVTEILASSGTSITASVPVRSLDDLARSDPQPAVQACTADSPAFWLYTSGTTGSPKAAMHRHGAIKVVCETYGEQVLGIRPDDRCLSAAKAFFAYGLGNSVLFPLAAGATAILEPSPSAPEVLAERARAFGATLFFAGPTFFANMLRAGLAPDVLPGIRLAVSAGEPLPAPLYERWTRHFGIDILDGIGMTEMLHIFLSNREGAVRPGTTGQAVPGYALRILDEDGRETAPGTPGTLYVSGESTATGYWSSYAASREVFQGTWLRTGDTYVKDADGYYTCLGRTGDMLKAGGIWVSPAEVEARLLAHPAVSQAAVVATVDTDGLEKPVAFVVPEGAVEAETEGELIAYCRRELPSFKRPRRVLFVDALPTTATGKIRRVELRARATGVLAQPEPDASPS
jgi:benzoate-CoA ligase family protein